MIMNMITLIITVVVNEKYFRMICRVYDLYINAYLLNFWFDLGGLKLIKNTYDPILWSPLILIVAHVPDLSVIGRQTWKVNSCWLFNFQLPNNVLKLNHTKEEKVYFYCLACKTVATLLVFLSFMMSHQFQSNAQSTYDVSGDLIKPLVRNMK